MKKAKSKVYPKGFLRKLRKRLNLSQEDFWAAIGITQSGGSRYEGGRRVPIPVAIAIELVHIRNLPLTELRKLRNIDLDILNSLRENPEEYQKYRHLVAKRRSLHGTATHSHH